MRPSRATSPFPINLKFILIGLTFALLLILTLRSSAQNPPPTHNNNNNTNDNLSNTYCNKIPPSLSHALIHYSTSTITPQQTLDEISVTSRILANKSPCNFLVFGLGHDSLMWAALNHGGHTVFLEEDQSWIEQIKKRFPMLESHHVIYDSKVNQANELMEIGRGPECTETVQDPRDSMCPLALKGLPSVVYEKEWDLIMVDAPTGYYDEAPGRMSAIYTAGLIARNKKDGVTDVFVHDVNREVEDKFSKVFLCEGYMKKQVGRLRHFRIPSHKDGTQRPFCPIVTN